MIMNRLAHILAIAATFLCSTAASHGQSAGQTFRIGFVALVSPGISEEWTKAFREELRKSGYEEGKNLVIESRYANGNRDKLKELVTELAQLKVDAFLTAGEPALLAAKDHGGNRPIVTVTCDPMERLVKSLARPGGNKRLGLLKSLQPAGQRVAALYSEPDNLESELQEVAAQGRQLGLDVARYPVRAPQDFEAAFRQMTDQKSDALYILSSSFANFHRKKFAELALANKLPAMYGFREFAQAGGLMSYGASLSDGFRRAAYQINKILKGATPADVPVEQPTRFELVLNMKTAKVLQLEVPTSLLVQADEVIE
jgi:putative ABC transport system substrate-binding protein